MHKKLPLTLLLSIGLLVCACMDSNLFGLPVGRQQDSLAAGPCIYFLSRAENAEGIYRDCFMGLQEQVFASEGITEYALNQPANLLASIRFDLESGEGIWTADLSGKNKKAVYACGEEICENLEIVPDGSGLIFSKRGVRPMLIHLNYDNGEELIISKAVIDWIDISPDGAYLRFHEVETGLLRIVRLMDMELVLSFPVDVDLIGAWSPDSTRFLVGERNNQGLLMVSLYSEIFVDEQKQEVLFALSEGVDYNTPIYSNTGTFYVLSRAGLQDNAKDIVEINPNGEIIKAISDQFNYDHAYLRWLPEGELLAFQQYDLSTSKSVPRVAVWEKNSGTITVIAENAVQPQWLK